jgi:predicted RNA binding protein YcfA (HicA-like mRNA interferase family)
MIDYSKLRSTTARRLIAALEADAFTLNRQKGSHRHFKHPDGRRVTVSFHHASDTFRPGTLRSMIEVQAQWTEEDLHRLGLLR